MRAESISAHDQDRADEVVEHLVASSPVVIVEGLVGDGLRLTYISPNVQWLFGYHPTELTGPPNRWLSKVHPEDLEQCRAALRTGLDGGGLQLELEFRMFNSRDECRWVSAVLCVDHATEISAGAASRAIGYLLDVTHLRAAEAELRRETERANRASQAKSEFLSRVSHELRTPLNAVLGFAQLLGMADLDEDDHESVERILEAGGHLLDLINDILDMSGIDSGTLAVTTEPVVVSQVLSEAIALVEPMAEAKSVTITASLGLLAALPVLADRQRLRQVVLNLLVNAVKYNHPGGSIDVVCSRSGSALRVEISDTGLGVDESSWERLFVPFDRLGTERQGMEGTSLALPLSRRLIEAMGGRLDVAHREGGGCTFWFELDSAGDGLAPDSLVPRGRVNRGSGRTFVAPNHSNAG